MKIILFVLFCFLNRSTFAQIVLVPEPAVTVLTYLDQCQKIGYTCSHLFVIEKLKSADTPKFNLMIENLDLISDESRKKLISDTAEILKTEMISTDQINSLIQIFEKCLQFEYSKRIDFLKKELMQISKELDQINESTGAVTNYLIFKKIISEKQFLSLKLKLQIQSYQFYKVDPYQLTEKKLLPIFFLTGNCESNQIATVLTERFKAQQVLPVFNNECSFSGEIQKSITSTKNFIVEHKKPFIWTAIAVGVMMFAKKYDVEFK